MITYLAETIAGEILFEYLPENTLGEIVSDPQRSIYVFTCGCNAVREARSTNCRVRWCGDHRKCRAWLKTPPTQSSEN